MSQKLGEVAVKTILKVNINGQATELRVLHQGNPDPDLYDASCDGVWVCLENIYTERVWDGTNNDYKNSDVQVYLNGPFLGLFDPDIQAVIKQVKIPYVNGTGTAGAAVASGANGLSCKIFLLAACEVGLTKSDNGNIPEDGAKLNYFQSGTSSAANQKRIAKYGSTDSIWLTRSLNKSGDVRVWSVASDGNLGGTYQYCYYTSGVRPAFVLPPTLFVNDQGFVVTNEPPTAPGSIEVTNVVSGGSATITLTAATDPDGTVASYRYERSVDGGQFQQFADVNSLTQTDTISEDWGTIAYRACAVDDAGAAGPYVTSETEVVNDGWLLIGGPVSNLGVKSMPFDFEVTIGVSGQSGVTDIAVQVKMDGDEIYNDTVNQGDKITIPMDTRVLGSGQHDVQVIASKEDYLSAAAAYVFKVPSYALPAEGRSQQLEGPDGQPIFPFTSSRNVIGPCGVSIQTEVEQIKKSYRGPTGHLAFVDTLLGPVSGYELAREENTAYAVQLFAPASSPSGEAVVCIYAGYTGQLSTYLNAEAEKLTFTAPANAILSIYKFVLDALPAAEKDPTVNFTALEQPKVVTAATNTGTAAADLNAALKAMMAQFPTQNYYAITNTARDVTYYVATASRVNNDTASITGAYVSSADPTKWYQGVQMTLVSTYDIPGLFDYLNPPMVASSTSANAVTAGATLNDTLLAMIKAQPTYYRYQMQNSSGAVFYLLSPTQITTDSLTASNVLYCTTGGTYYNGESINFVPAEFPDPSTLTLGNTISWAEQSWIVSDVDSANDECYLTMENIYSQTTFDDDYSGDTYIGSDLANTAMNFQAKQLTAAHLACLKQKTVSGVSAKVFVATYEQMNGGFAWFNSNSRRKLGNAYWTSTPDKDFPDQQAYYIDTNGEIIGGAMPHYYYGDSIGFRPSVCLDMSLLG